MPPDLKTISQTRGKRITSLCHKRSPANCWHGTEVEVDEQDGPARHRSSNSSLSCGPVSRRVGATVAPVMGSRIIGVFAFATMTSISSGEPFGPPVDRRASSRELYGVDASRSTSRRCLARDMKARRLFIERHEIARNEIGQATAAASASRAPRHLQVNGHLTSNYWQLKDGIHRTRRRRLRIRWERDRSDEQDSRRLRLYLTTAAIRAVSSPLSAMPST